MIKKLLLLFVLLIGCTAQAQNSVAVSPLPASLKIGISSDTYPEMFIDEQ